MSKKDASFVVRLVFVYVLDCLERKLIIQALNKEVERRRLIPSDKENISYL